MSGLVKPRRGHTRLTYTFLFFQATEQALIKQSSHCTQLIQSGSPWVERVHKLKDKKEELAEFQRVREQELIVKGTFLGMVEKGMNASSSEHLQLKELDPDLAAGFSVIKQNKSPDLGSALWLMAIGAGAGLLGVVSGIRGF